MECELRCEYAVCPVYVPSPRVLSSPGCAVRGRFAVRPSDQQQQTERKQTRGAGVSHTADNTEAAQIGVSPSLLSAPSSVPAPLTWSPCSLLPFGFRADPTPTPQTRKHTRRPCRIDGHFLRWVLV